MSEVCVCKYARSHLCVCVSVSFFAKGLVSDLREVQFSAPFFVAHVSTSFCLSLPVCLCLCVCVCVSVSVSVVVSACNLQECLVTCVQYIRGFFFFCKTSWMYTLTRACAHTHKTPVNCNVKRRPVYKRKRCRRCLAESELKHVWHSLTKPYTYDHCILWQCDVIADAHLLCARYRSWYRRLKIEVLSQLMYEIVEA